MRREFPDLPIYVADQSLQLAPQEDFYRQMNVRLIRMPFDSGVCASRNALVAAMDSDFFVLCDDDFILGPRTRFDGAVRILQTHPDIGVVGGRLYDFEGGRYQLRNWELFLQLDTSQRLLTAVPIARYAPRARELGALRFFMCDAVMNFAVMRRSMFSAEIGWDEHFKSNGEHEDFYLNLKMRNAAKVCYLPDMVAYHHHPQEYRTYRHRMRERMDGWRLFMEKWGIDQHLEVGGDLRSIGDIAQTLNERQARARFYVNADLATRPASAPGERLGIAAFESLVPVGVLDETGEQHSGALPSARLLLDTASGRLIAVPEPSTPGLERADEPAERPEIARTRTPETAGSQVLPPDHIGFRYDCIARDDADFVVWYRIEAHGVDSAESADTFDVVLRWWSGNRVLVWQSDPLPMDLALAGTWRPLLVDMPIWPADAAVLRFELFGVDSQAGPCLGTGYLGRVTQPSAARETFDIMTLHVAAAPAGAAGHDLKPNAVSRMPPEDVVWPASAEGLFLVRIDGGSVHEAIYLVDWPGTGAALVRIEVSGERGWLALPRPPAAAGRAALYHQIGQEAPCKLTFVAERSREKHALLS